MQNSAAIPSRGAAPSIAAPQLLLVSSSRRWRDAVKAAAREIHGARVAICAAREAVVRLAGTTEQYSHVLVQPRSADGWLSELVALSAASRSSQTELFLLAPPEPPPPRVGVIRSADSRLVRDALSPPSPPPAQEEPGMDLTELRDALAGAMINTRYQPIVRMSDRQPIGLEALARLNHPTRGVLLPDYFVPQLEDAGLAEQLTDRVASRAFTDMAGPVGALGLVLSLNFPLDVLLVPEAQARLDACRQKAGMRAERVAVELTESRMVEDMAGLGRALENLRRLGYRISIDDVAPTTHRVAELLALPFTSVKLDKHAVQGCAQPENEQFIGSVVQMARRQGMVVIAEGVEDLPTWRRIHALGAEYAQGFLVARPLPAAAVSVWHEAWVHRAAL